MKQRFFLIISLLLLSGCAAKYIEPLPTEPSAQISFERDVQAPLLGSTTHFFELDNTFTCTVNNQRPKRMATIDKGNPLVKDDNNRAIRILAKNNFRMMVRSAAGYNWCDVVIGFEPEENKNYKLKAIANLKSSFSSSCSVEVTELSGGKEVEITLTEYEECKIQ